MIQRVRRLDLLLPERLCVEPWKSPFVVQMNIQFLEGNQITYHYFSSQTFSDIISSPEKTV
jgi:hypothetical protein